VIVDHVLRSSTSALDHEIRVESFKCLDHSAEEDDVAVEDQAALPRLLEERIELRPPLSVQRLLAMEDADSPYVLELAGAVRTVRLVLHETDGDLWIPAPDTRDAALREPEIMP